MITHVNKLVCHFAAGGAPLNRHDMAAVLGIPASHASVLLVRLDQWNGVRWQVEMTRSPHLKLHSLVVLDCDLTTSDRVRRALRECPHITNRELYREFGCARSLVCQLRKEIREHPNGKPNASSGGTSKPQHPTHSHDEALRCAERMRQMWPAPKE